MSQIFTIPTGILSVNTYVIADHGKAIVIDPGGDAPKIIRQIAADALAAVLLTHSHYDHLGAVNELLAAFPAAGYYCHPRCAAHANSARDNFSAEICGAPYAVGANANPLADETTLTIADFKIKTFFVPGHTDDSLCFYLPNEKALFCGDTVFAGSVGRSDLPGGDGDLLIQKILVMLKNLPADTIIFPGHGESSTVATELAANPYLR